MFFVEGTPAYLILGATLLAVGNVFFEFASVNYYAMLTQVSTRENIGRVSGFGWGMGYVGGIVLLLLLLVLFIQSFSNPDAGGLLAVSKEGGLNIRIAILASALWYAVFAIPVLVRVPEIPAQRRQVRVGFFRSYVVLWGTLRSLWRDSRQVLLFLVASAVFRDGLTGCSRSGRSSRPRCSGSARPKCSTSPSRRTSSRASARSSPGASTTGSARSA